VRRIYAVLVFLAVACGTSPVAAGPSVAIPTSAPQVAVPTPSFAPGACTRAGIDNIDVIHRWLELAGRHDAAAVRDCFAVSYGVPDAIVARWADLGPATSSEVSHGANSIQNGCDFFTVRASFPNGNPYAPVQAPNDMFFVVGIGADGDRPRIFGTATAAVDRSPDVTPHAGPPDCH
jgi:hypothetical protein